MLKKLLLTIILFFCLLYLSAQVKVSGIVVDSDNKPIPFSNIVFKGSTLGTISDENGKFYIQSDVSYKQLEVSFVGYEINVVQLKKENYDLTILLKETTDQLGEIVVYSGRIKKKGNPAIAILKKIWKNKRKNGVNMYDKYQYDRYEKIEFDLNNVDEQILESKIFEGMEFAFAQIDTSEITGKVYLPVFINESVSKIYGKNINPKTENTKLLANKNSGYSNNQRIISFIKQLYVEYNIYDNNLFFFDKKFASPLSRFGPEIYNYVLTDSAFIDNKWCFNILFYPRRKNELTFKGDFWVNDTTFAIKEIQMYATKGANINWVKDIYIEQEFNVLNDSVFLLKKDYLMTDFSWNRKDKSKGIYGRRTTLFDNYIFNLDQPDIVYKKTIHEDDIVYKRPEEYWLKNRQEPLSENELGIYEMLDSLQEVKRFKQINRLGEMLASGYWNFTPGFSFGHLSSTFGYNDVEGFRLRLGARTFYTNDDKWRVSGYIAYGFMDHKFKHGIEGKWLLKKENRLILSAGTRKDIEQLGVSLTTANDILERSFATTSIFTYGDNTKLTNINLTNVKVTLEPVKNLNFRVSSAYKILESTNPEVFNVDYFDENGDIQSVINQVDASFAIMYNYNKDISGLGVERRIGNKGRYSTLFFSYTKGIKNLFNSDFDYHKFQFFYQQPITIGGLGRLTTTLEIGKTINPVPLLLLNIVPGNQTVFTSKKLFDLLAYYEFVTDQYIALHLEHNFNGRIFSRIPLIRKLQWREIIGIRGVVGSISQENIALNAPSNVPLNAPEELYWEYHFGIGNIFKFIRIDFEYRGSYRDVPNATKFAVKGGFGFYF